MVNNRNAIISNVRSHLRRLAKSRKTRMVTADDVHTYLDKQNKRWNTNARLSVIQSAFSAPEFRAAGETASQREAARYRKITEYRVK